MSLLQLIIISLIQGITEWLPISSSGHVLLAADYFALEGRDEYLINAMAHIGTLFAVLLYFWRDVARALAGSVELTSARLKRANLGPNAQLALHILVSIPFAVVVMLLYEFLLPETLKASMRSVWVVGATSIIFGLALWWADVKGGTQRSEHDMTVRDAALIGATQAIAALLPGTSRSGITMTAARALGFERTEAARFSMLIGAPLLAAVGGYALLQLSVSNSADGIATLTDGLIVAGLSFISGFASIAILMEMLKRISFLPFVIYRLLLGIILLISAPMLGLI
ncbi:MAG: undecaprenyl-diphosphate phosphatase [Henriciella sp.]|nr:undecaprenyl-diphosphate phosphatase [Henriciella sp.]